MTTPSFTRCRPLSTGYLHKLAAHGRACSSWLYCLLGRGGKVLLRSEDPTAAPHPGRRKRGSDGWRAGLDMTEM